MSALTGRGARVRQAIDLLIRTSRSHHRNIEKLFGDTGLHRGQRKLLMHLSHATSALSQRELADRLDVSPAYMARALKGLTAGGYITCAENATDSRRNDIEITLKGRKIIAETEQAFDEFDLRCFSEMDDAEIDRLIALLGRVLENLRRTESQNE